MHPVFHILLQLPKETNTVLLCALVCHLFNNLCISLFSSRLNSSKGRTLLFI